jgi:hypothetical protein
MKSVEDETIPQFPILSRIAAAALSVPHGNAAVERVFSQLFDLITRKRNR